MLYELPPARTISNNWTDTLRDTPSHQLPQKVCLPTATVCLTDGTMLPISREIAQRISSGKSMLIVEARFCEAIQWRSSAPAVKAGPRNGVRPAFSARCEPPAYLQEPRTGKKQTTDRRLQHKRVLGCMLMGQLLLLRSAMEV